MEFYYLKYQKSTHPLIGWTQGGGSGEPGAHASPAHVSDPWGARQEKKLAPALWKQYDALAYWKAIP
jgi:hypothetical protein